MLANKQISESDSSECASLSEASVVSAQPRKIYKNDSKNEVYGPVKKANWEVTILKNE